jgi:hypothetical protein
MASDISYIRPKRFGGSADNFLNLGQRFLIHPCSLSSDESLGRYRIEVNDRHAKIHFTVLEMQPFYAELEAAVRQLEKL